MPIWIQLPKLKVEYKSEGSLKKIAGIVGNVIKLDNATRQKTRLRFSRVLVEMKINDDFPEEIHFTNVKDELVTQQVVYEWKPIMCTSVTKWVTMNKNAKETKGRMRPQKRQQTAKRQGWIPIGGQETICSETKTLMPRTRRDQGSK